jgi:hypothetical protein
MSFKKLKEPVYDKNLQEYTHKCNDCGRSMGAEYFGSWILPSGEFGDDRWVVECFACGHTAMAK